jgi:hypothetical protein
MGSLSRPEVLALLRERYRAEVVGLAFALTGDSGIIRCRLQLREPITTIA